MPNPPIELPPDLRLFLADKTFALVSVGTSDGAALVAKMETRDIESCRGRVPVLARYELHNTRSGPVVRLLLEIHAQPAWISLETFCNVQDPRQLAEWRALLARPELRVIFYDETITHRLSKIIGQPRDAAAQNLLPEALRLLAYHDPAALDFDRAKADVMETNPL